jgi:hypothetical protein
VSVTVDTSYVWLLSFVNTQGTSAEFAISTDGVTWQLAGAISSGLPSVSQLCAPCVAIRKVNTGSTRTIAVDMMADSLGMVRG